MFMMSNSILKKNIVGISSFFESLKRSTYLGGGVSLWRHLCVTSTTESLAIVSFVFMQFQSESE